MTTWDTALLATPIQVYINHNVSLTVHQIQHALTQEHFQDAIQTKDIALSAKLIVIAR